MKFSLRYPLKDSHIFPDTISHIFLGVDEAGNDRFYFYIPEDVDKDPHDIWGPYNSLRTAIEDEEEVFWK
jgi:hypothetical protein